jgi:hypothetical protein
MVMKKKLSKRIDSHEPERNMVEDFRALSNRIFLYANRGLPRIEFMREVSRMLLDLSGCDAVELRLNRRDKCYRSETMRHLKRPFCFEIMPCAQNEEGQVIPRSQDDSRLERLCRDIVGKRSDPSLPFFTENGSFFTNNVKDFLTY